MDAGTVKTTFVEENIQAEEFIGAGDLPAAAKILVPLIEKDPQNFRAYNNIGMISWNQKDWEAAYTMFMRSLSINPTYIDAAMNLFDAALKLKRIHLIQSIIRKGAELSSDDNELTVLNECIESEGDDIYISPRAFEVGVYNKRIEEANKLLEASELNAAASMYLDINAQEGNSWEGFNGLGIISFYKKEYKDAFTLFYESIKLNPMNADTFRNFFDSAKECGLTDEAFRLFYACKTEIPELEAIEEELKIISEK